MPMRRLLSLGLLFSFLSIQFHGLMHSASDVKKADHQCAVCETVAHNLASDPSLDTPEQMDYPGRQLFFQAEGTFLSKILFLSGTSSRGPPAGA
jgi:hypothetical protein